MPSLGADMNEGTLLEWLVKPGDAVRRGDIIAVVDTVKAAIDVEAFEDGEVERLLVDPGTTVDVGTALALIRGTDASPTVGTTNEPGGGRDGVATPPGTPGPAEPPTPAGSAASPDAAASPIVRHLAHEHGIDLATVAGTGPDGTVTRHDVEVASATPVVTSPRTPPAIAGQRVAASPLARRRATDLGVDLAVVAGTGPGGAVTVADVEVAAARRAAPASPARAPVVSASSQTDSGAPTTQPGPDAAPERAMSRQEALQAATGALMARSKKEIPHYYLETTIDLSAVMDWLTEHNTDRSSANRVLPAALLLLATARTIRAVPGFNGFFTDVGFEPQDHVHLGVAVSQRGGGLVVASLRDADTMSVDDFMAALKDVATRARTGRLRSSEMTVPTVTVTNLGDQGADLVHGVIYPPQVAIVGFGRIINRPWAVDDMLAVRPLVIASLAGDHRVSDGHRGSRFLAALAAALQRPEEL